MKHLDNPLTIEVHDGYKDIYVKKDLPGKFTKFDLYFVVTLVLIVLLVMFIQGVTDLANYLISVVVLILLSGVYKGFKVGIDSIGYTPYETPYLTRLADDFLIWADDPPLAISDEMKVVVRPPDQQNQGVVYLYEQDNRHITFVANDNIYLEQFASLLMKDYDLPRSENVNE